MVKFSSLFGSLSVSRLALSVNLSKICNVVDNAPFFSVKHYLNIQIAKLQYQHVQFLSFYFHIKSKTAFLETFSNLSNILLGCTHIHTGNFFHWSLEPNWRPVQIKVPFECNTVDKCFIHTNTVQCSMTQSKVPKTPEYIPQNVYFLAKLI